MYGNAMYEMARLHVAEQQRAARQAGEARLARAAARARRARKRAQKEAPETVTMPVIPDFAEEMFTATGDAVPAPREGTTRGRHARSGH
jgi:hypothetical protein